MIGMERLLCYNVNVWVCVNAVRKTQSGRKTEEKK